LLLHCVETVLRPVTTATAEMANTRDGLDTTADTEYVGPAGSAAKNQTQLKAVKNRRLIISSRRTIVVALKVFLLFAGASAYFAASFGLERKEFDSQFGAMADQAYAARRNTIFRDAGASVRELLFATGRRGIFRPPEFGAAAGTYMAE